MDDTLQMEVNFNQNVNTLSSIISKMIEDYKIDGVPSGMEKQLKLTSILQEKLNDNLTVNRLGNLEGQTPAFLNSELFQHINVLLEKLVYILESLEKSKIAKELFEKRDKFLRISPRIRSTIHELNNILGSMIGYAQLAKMTGDARDFHRCVDTSLNSALRAKELMIEMKNIIQQNESTNIVNISELIEEIVEFIKPLMEKDAIAIYYSCDKIPLVIQDRTLICCLIREMIYTIWGFSRPKDSIRICYENNNGGFEFSAHLIRQCNNMQLAFDTQSFTRQIFNPDELSILNIKSISSKIGGAADIVSNSSNEIIIRVRFSGNPDDSSIS